MPAMHLIAFLFFSLVGCLDLAKQSEKGASNSFGRFSFFESS